MKEYKLKIKVTKDIIKQSMMCGSDSNLRGQDAAMFIQSNCAISLACKQIFGICFVGWDSIKRRRCIRQDFFNERSDWSIQLPIEACIFIDLFDNLQTKPEQRLNLEELEFEVILPEEYINSIDINEVKEILKDSKTLVLL